jgi:hypothetical protein
MRLSSSVAVTAVALCAPAAAAASTLPQHPPLKEADYWAFADSVVPALDPLWSERRHAYISSWQGASGRTNANMLILHAMAALRGHDGATRDDARARWLVFHMTHRPMARLSLRSSNRTVCWTRETDSPELDHISLDSQIAEALDYAWIARRQLGLGRARARRIRTVVDRCARHVAWQFPACLLNQINWNAELYAHAAHITGHGDQLRGDYRRFLARFAAGITRPMPGMATSNLGPGYAFHYQPNKPAWTRLNLDVPEYANLVASALGHYGAARHAGMAPLGPPARRLLTAWQLRLLAGSWTHAGYLNWDTGYGRGRWHSGQYWAFSQQALLAMASTPQFWADRDQGRWAKHIFDEGLLLYARWAREASSARAPQLPFDVRAEHRDKDLYASRIAANAVRAIHLGLPRIGALEPPPMYAFDAHTRRLAVSTPHYSTAIVATSRRAFPYDGIDLARLYGPGQRPAGDIGGRPPAAFGAVVRDTLGHSVLRTRGLRGRGASLRLTRSPQGAVAGAPRYPAKPLAGPFREVAVRGHVAGNGVGVVTAHRFDATTIASRWRMNCEDGCAARRMTVSFPTWGRAAQLRAAMADGTEVRIERRSRPLPAGGVAHVELGRGARGGYELRLRDVPPGTVLAAVRPHRQAWDPHPGPTLLVRLPRGRRDVAATLEPFGA